MNSQARIWTDERDRTLVFDPPPEISWARRVLLKPYAPYAEPYPKTTSRELIEAIIEGIRRVSDADIILLEGSLTDQPVRSIYRFLGYDFPRVQFLDVRECTFVEVENPLGKPFALSSFWVPNVVLSCDYLISIAPFQILGNRGTFTVENLLGLLPLNKYRGATANGREFLARLGLMNVLADLYFTVPFDLGIVDARYKVVETNGAAGAKVESFGKIFLGDPFQADMQAAQAAGLEMSYLRLIQTGQASLASLNTPSSGVS